MAASEGDDLQSLLDAFPTAPVELIASAYVDAHSDPELAAEIIASSLRCLSDGLPTTNTPNAAATVPADRTLRSRSKPRPWRRPYPLPLRPPTLEEFFPSSPETNAWTEPLVNRKNSSSHNEDASASLEVRATISRADFPSLQKKSDNEKCSTPLLRPSGSHGRRRGESAAFGLASSARIMNRSGNPIKAASTASDSVEPSKQAESQAEKVQETSLWPTEAEASLLSMLGDDGDIESVRDVLGFFRGDIQKSFEALKQMYSSSPSHSQFHEKVSNTLCGKRSTLTEDVAEVESNTEVGEVDRAKKVDNCSTLHAETLQAYETFEKAILQHESSSMKWVVERLCSKYPRADMAMLLEALRSTNFDLNDAEKMMQEVSLHEESPSHEERKEPYKVAKEILETLFNKPQEITESSTKNHKTVARRTKESCSEVLEMPKWKVITSTALEALGYREEEEHTRDTIQGKKVDKSSDIGLSYSQGGKKSYGDWNDFERHQASAKQHWKTMQSYSTAATAAYASSDFQKSEVLVEKANMYKQLSMKAKERANACLLEIQNQQNEADFTLDLREQHVSEALQLLRFHLKTFSSIPSCNFLIVFMGCFENPKPSQKKIREEVIGYLEKKGYKWVEISQYNLQIQLRETLEK